MLDRHTLEHVLGGVGALALLAGEAPGSLAQESPRDRLRETLERCEREVARWPGWMRAAMAVRGIGLEGGRAEREIGVPRDIARPAGVGDLVDAVGPEPGPAGDPEEDLPADL